MYVTSKAQKMDCVTKKTISIHRLLIKVCGQTLKNKYLVHFKAKNSHKHGSATALFSK